MKGNYKKHIESILTSDEIYSIEKLLGRKPNDFELNMFAAMWSEHISYKSSVKWLDEFPLEGENIRIPALAENAGVIDLNGDTSCVVKMESHNHPVAGNPGEASVAVGNILRDIVSMGAKPAALLNIMRFGNSTEQNNVDFINQVIASLGNYSNNFGIPVVGGELLFGKGYSNTPLVNIMAVGLVKKDKIVTASFKEKGDLIFLIGGKTTGFGVHGAGFASKPFSSDLAHLIPSSQLADPQLGRILCDCLLEMNENNILSGMQDIGAGGVLCAASEMAFRGNKGVRIEIGKIPVTDNDLSAIDILLSQSQDQMLVAVKEDNAEKLIELADKWKVQHAEIGEVIGNGIININYNEEVLANLSVSSLVKGGGAPVYLRNLSTKSIKAVRISAEDVPFPGDLKGVARQLIQHPNIASRKYMYEQFDTKAGYSCQGFLMPADSGILCLPGSNELIALAVDGNSRYVQTEPRSGSMIAVAEAVRQIICSGAKPVAITNGLNFGDPSDLDVYRSFVESVKGIKRMAEKLKIPIIAGNVSFNNVYNSGESSESVQSTPIVGLVGIIEDKLDAMTIGFQSKGDMIYLLGESDNDLSGSEYLSAIHFVEETSAPEIDIEKEMQLLNALSYLVKNKLVSSAHDISLGGLFVSLLECCLPNNLGFDITSPAEVRTDAFLFGESQSRIIVSVNSENETAFLDYMIENKFPVSALGHVTKQELRIDDLSFGFITDYVKLYEDALESILNNKEAK